MPVQTEEGCYHCGEAATGEIVKDDHSFCCPGCLGAYEIIQGSGMLDYYAFRTEYAPRPDRTTGDEIWNLIESNAVDRPSPDLASDGEPDPHHDNRARADFLIEGIHCSSCIWLNETMLRKIPGVLKATGNLATNRLQLEWAPSRIPLKDLALRIERLGYRLLPLSSSDASREQKDHARGLLKRMVVAAFFAGNIMLVSVALYAGYFGTMDRFTRNFFHLVSFGFATPVLFYSAAIFFRNALSALRHRLLSMDLLTAAGLAIAYIYSVYAAFFEAGEVYFDSICFVTFAVLAGRYLESRLKLRSLYLVDNLRQGESPYARRITDDNGTEEIVPSESLVPGDRILLNPGETLPCDARLLEERAELEQSLLTGEFEPVLRNQGDLLLSGVKAISPVRVEVVRPGSESALQQIQDMAAESLNHVPSSQRWAEKAGRYFVGFVLIASLAAFLFHYVQSDLATAVVVTVTLLIVACPCALNLAIPTAFIAGLQRAYSQGVLFRNGEHLENIARARSILLDKTGTITSGKMSIAREWFFDEEDPEPATKKEENRNHIRLLTRKMESASGLRHPVVRAFESAYGHINPGPGFSDSTAAAAASPEAKPDYFPGKGLRLRAGDTDYFLGSLAWIQSLMHEGISTEREGTEGPGGQGMAHPRNGIATRESTPAVAMEGLSGTEPGPVPLSGKGSYNGSDRLGELESAAGEQRTVIALAMNSEEGLNSKLLAAFALEDGLRDDVRDTLADLRSRHQITVLSGDTERHVAALCKQLDIKDFRGNLSPNDKRDFVAELEKTRRTIMVGDGINDSGALSAAGTGISLAGGAGLALLNSDVILLNNDIGDLKRIIRIAGSTRRKIMQNLGLAFAYNVLLIPAAFLGWISPFLGAVFMSLSSITVIVNSMFAGRRGTSQ